MGAFCPIILSGWIRKYHFSRKLIVFLGIFSQLVSYLVIFINLPDSAVFGNTGDISLIKPSEFLALLCSVLLSFGDSCIATQIYSFIGDYYRENSAEACALYKFFKGVFVAVSFYVCSHLGLHTQVAILTIMAIIGFVAFFLADRETALNLDNKIKEEPRKNSHL